jgi:glycosyltransferase involved in cell wall biosynthesis
VGGIPYLVGTDKSTGGDPAGWVVEPKAAALAAALPIASAEAPHVAKIARERYLRYFHPNVLTAQLIEIYSELTGNSDQPLR